MTDDSWNDELSQQEIRQLDALLENPELWDEPDAADEDAIVAAILAETGAKPPVETSNLAVEPSRQAFEPSNVVSISRPRRWLVSAISAAAGVIIALIGVAAFSSFTNRPVDGTVELALVGTELAPDAAATATIADLPAGARIELDVSMLPPAAPGTYYEFWLRKDADIGVSAGTFHMRGGDSEIELWAGVSATEYPLVTVTIQQEADPTSSGRVVLRGLLTTES